jgi:hypothetical protein
MGLLNFGRYWKPNAPITANIQNRFVLKIWARANGLSTSGQSFFAINRGVSAVIMQCAITRLGLYNFKLLKYKDFSELRSLFDILTRSINLIMTRGNESEHFP